MARPYPYLLDIGYSHINEVPPAVKSMRAADRDETLTAYRTVFRRTIVDVAASAAIGMSST